MVVELARTERGGRPTGEARVEEKDREHARHRERDDETRGVAPSGHKPEFTGADLAEDLSKRQLCRRAALDRREAASSGAPVLLFQYERGSGGIFFRS
jgi:hypothetical protein